MSKTVLLVGTRKGCFVLESDESRRDWELRGPFCEGWPIYHAVHDAETGAIYAAAASEWHGASVWRSPDLGETWAAVERGPRLRRRRRAQALEGVYPHRGDGRLLVGAEAPGVFESRDGGETWSLLTTLDGPAGQRGMGRPGEPAARASRHLRAIMPTPTTRPASGRSSRASACSRRPTTAPSWTPRNRGLRADWPRENAEVGYCVHKLVLSPVDGDRDVPAEPRRHAPQRRRAASRGRRSPRACRREFGFAAAAHPHDRDTFYVIPLDPGHGRCMPDGHAAVWRTQRRGLELAAARRGLPQRDAHLGVLREGDGDRLARTRPASTSGRAPARSSRAPTRARAGARSRATCPAISSVEVAVDRRSMADVHLPSTLTPLFAGLPRRARGGRGHRRRGDRPARERWPGLRDRLCEPGPALRPHIHVYVDRERAGLDTPLDERSRVDVIAAISGG